MMWNRHGDSLLIIFLHDFVLFGILHVVSPKFREHQLRVKEQTMTLYKITVTQTGKHKWQATRNSWAYPTRGFTRNGVLRMADRRLRIQQGKR